MAEAAFLKFSKVVQTSNLTDMKFGLDGFLLRFTLNDIKYRHTLLSDFREEDRRMEYGSSGYFEEHKFLQYISKEIRSDEIIQYMLPENFLTTAITGDTVYVKRLKVEAPFTDFCKALEYSWSYVPTDPKLDNDFNIIIPEGIIPITTVVPVGDIAKLFYTHKISLYVNSLQSTNVKLQIATILAKIALNIDRINKDVFSLFHNDLDPGFTTYIGSQNLEWTSSPIFENPAISDFENYLSFTSSFYKSAFSNQITIQNASDDQKLYWLAYSLSPQSLEIIPAYDKLKLLEFIAKGTILGDTNNIFGGVNEEFFVLKIVESISQGQIEEFLPGLLKSYEESANNSDTLYTVLYDKVNDVGLGSENLKQLMHLLYKKWLLSSYYPYNLDQTVKDNVVNPELYENKPISIDYMAGDILWIFNNTNYNFEFNKKLIDVKEDRIQINPVTGNAIPIQVTVGTYAIYQSITIRNTDDNTENTKFITVDIDEESKAVLPIFYLKYIDDKKATENLITAAELTFDLALTVSGIGNLAKLRHLKHLSPFGRLALGLEAPGANLIRYELAQGVAGLIEVSSSVASILLNYGNTYENTYCNVSSQSYNLETCEFYKKLAVIVEVMQIFSGILDYATSRQLRNASKKLLEGPIPVGFNADALVILQKFAGNPVEIDNLFRARLAARPEIIQQLDNLPITPINRQEMFALDFGNASEAILDQLNSNPQLMDRWNLLSPFGLVNERKSIEFLSNEASVLAHVRYYEQISIRQVLDLVPANKRIAFLDKMGDIAQTDFERFINNPALIQHWIKYYDDLTLRGNFQALTQTKQIDFLDIFGGLGDYWHDRIRRQPYLFQRFDDAAGESVILIGQDPKFWIRVNKLYIRGTSLLPKLTNSEILQRFGHQGLTLVNAVETRSKALILSFSSRTSRGANQVLVSGMIDKNTGIMSELFTNFSKEEKQANGLYDVFLETGTNPDLNMHPNLRIIVDKLEAVGASMYNMSNFDDLKYTGEYIASHAEVRALDSLIKKTFGNGLGNEDMFNDWIKNNVLGYNRNIVTSSQNEIIMQPCAHCFYITDLVTFIK